MTKLLAVALLLIAPTLILAGPVHFFDKPDTTYATNVVIDIIEHAGGIWFATGEGLNYSLDSGKTWLLYNDKNGLPSKDVSAIWSDGTRLWVATNYTGLVGGEEVSYSDTLVYTDDNGENFHEVNFGPTGSNVPFAAGPFRTYYDVTGATGFAGKDWVFAAAFAGGLLGSVDRGVTWQRVFPGKSDSLNFANAYGKPQLDTLWWRNEYFACVADTSHGDSMFLWAGTAGGILQYIFNTPRNRFYTYGIQKLAYCQSCQGKGSDSAFLFIGGKNGVTRSRVNGNPYITRDMSDGLPGSLVTGLFEFGGSVFVGTADSTTEVATGLAVSHDYGDTYPVSLTTPAVTGVNHQIRDFAAIRNRVYMAVQEGGLWVSPDTGGTWSPLYLDSASTSVSNGWNITWSLDALGDTLFVATDSGLAMLFLAQIGSIDSIRLERMPNNATSSSRVAQVRLQTWGLDTLTGITDSFAVWTIQRPNGVGTPSIGRSTDRGLTWEFYQTGVVSRQLAIAADTVFVVDTTGIKLANTNLDTISFNKADVRVGNDTVSIATTVAAYRNHVAVGADRVLAVSQTQGKTWALLRPNLNSLVPDLVGLYTDTTTQNLDSGVYTTGMSGNFITALAVRYQPGGKVAQVVASCKPTLYGSESIALGTEVPITVVGGDSLNPTTDTVGYGYKWRPIYGRSAAWNFDAHGSDTIFMATDGGLLAETGALTNEQQVDTIAFKNAAGVSLLLPGTPVYAVRQIGGDLWAGTEDGTVRIKLSDLNDQDLFFKVDPGEDLYAYPVPFSPNRGDLVRFHFPVPTAGNVTLEIYDFAMHLVATPVKDRYFEAGVYPPGPLEGERVYWNGHNDRGDLVAVGMYYIKIIYGDGSINWGKLAIVP